MQQNCQITRCARQHTMDSVLKSAKLRRDLTGNRNGFTHARPALCSRVSPKLDEHLSDKFANRISNLTKISIFSTQLKYKIGFGPMVVSTCQLQLYQEIYRLSLQLPFFGWCWSEFDVTYGILAMAAIVCWQSEADCAESKSEPNVWNKPD